MIYIYLFMNETDREMIERDIESKEREREREI